MMVVVNHIGACQWPADSRTSWPQTREQMIAQLQRTHVFLSPWFDYIGQDFIWEVFVSMFCYNSVVHPVSYKRAWPFNQLHLKSIPFQNKKFLQIPKSPITIIREDIFSYLCIFTLICSFNQYYSLFHSYWTCWRFLCLLFLSPLHFSAFFFLSSVLLLPSYLHRWHVHILHTSESSS